MMYKNNMKQLYKVNNAHCVWQIFLSHQKVIIKHVWLKLTVLQYVTGSFSGTEPAKVLNDPIVLFIGE